MGQFRFFFTIWAHVGPNLLIVQIVNHIRKKCSPIMQMTALLSNQWKVWLQSEVLINQYKSEAYLFGDTEMEFVIYFL